MDEREDPTPVQPVPIEMSEATESVEPDKPAGPVGWRKLLTPKALAIIIGALSTAGATWFQLFTKDPDAVKTQEYISGPVKNELATMEKQMRIMHVRMVQLQASQECDTRTKALEDKFRIEGQLMDANRTITELKLALSKKGTVKLSVKPTVKLSKPSMKPLPVVHCRKGYAEVKGRYKRVSKDVAETLQKAHGETAAAKIMVEAEKFKRKRAEDGKAKLKKIMIQKAAEPPAPMPMAPWEKPK